MNLVTMQNHFPYDGLYDDPIANTLRSDALGQYARGMAHSDQATEKLLGEAAAGSREETLVIFYGDHLPGAVYDDDVIQANLDKQHRDSVLHLVQPSAASRRRVCLPPAPSTSCPSRSRPIGAPVPPYYALLLGPARRGSGR